MMAAARPCGAAGAQAEGRRAVKTALLVSIGGVSGALARYYLGLAIAGRWGGSFPYATLLINLSGSFVLGLLATLAIAKPALVPPEARLLLGVGFCGAYTTFSTFGVETVTLVQQGAWGTAGLYVLLSNALGLLAAFAGVAAARAWV
jgi:CrcB protein